jgi:pimeloyl-ACP methyl ester carboxylesterase
MQLDLADGRRLEVLVDGPADGLPVLFHFGTPSGAVADPALFGAAARRGLRSVVWSRPGYGDSTPRPGRRVADVAADARAVLAALDADRFVTFGASGGGPHALACAALVPGCAAAACVAGVAPFDAAGLDWLAGMGEENVAEFAAARAGVDELTRFLQAQVPVLADATADDVVKAFGSLLPDVDRRTLTGGFAATVAASFRRSVATGIAGWRDDDLAFLRDWGFPLGGAPVTVWQGGQDRMVPYPHGEWLAAHLPGARVHLLPDEGHLSLLVGAAGRILDELVELAT